MSDSNAIDSQMGEYKSEVDRLWDKLMGFELQLVDQLEVSDFPLSHIKQINLGPHIIYKERSFGYTYNFSVVYY